MAETRLIAGVMSGTSADGVDVALVRIAGRGADMSACLLRHHSRPYPQPVRERIFRIRGGEPSALAALADLGRQIALEYAAAVNETLLACHLSAGDLACVAAHGQTLFHEPPLTLQWIDPAVLAAEVGCAVVSDFRRADCAAGGQGAPLVPFADFLLFRRPDRSRVLVNIGGIANLTWLAAGAWSEAVLAFDAGPGNCLSDDLMRRMEPDGPGMDVDGRRAAAGNVIHSVVERVLRHPWFGRCPPKSTDGPAMIAVFQSSLPDERCRLEDLLATAAEIVVESLLRGLRNFLPALPDEVIVSGGGIHNAAIMARLGQGLDRIPLRTSTELGLVSQAKEALAFALLGAATLDGVPSNVPAATGASRAVVLGSITPRP